MSHQEDARGRFFTKDIMDTIFSSITRQTIAGLCVYCSVLLIVGCSSTKPTPLQPEDGFAFALIGDMPYGADGVRGFDKLIEDINSRQLDWVLHAGDIKTGGEPCTDDFLEDRVTQLMLFEVPLIVTPGDNEWTDCHRATAGQFDPLERLAKLRTLLYPQPGSSLGINPMPVQSQAALAQFAEFPENVRWIKQDVVFATLHVVGSLNGMYAFEGRTEAHDREADRRMEAAIQWMKDAFAEAERRNSPGVFLMIHANPGFGEAPDVFKPFLTVLEEETIRFNKPVMLAHGDSHYFRIDKPLMGTSSSRRIENFTRVETFGAGDMHWLQITVAPDHPNVFLIQQRIVEANRVDHSR